MGNISYEMQQITKTLKHIRQVQELLRKCADKLTKRAIVHDASKFTKEEWPHFLLNTESLAALTYGSKEYKEKLKQMRPAIEEHYKTNRHHPEHFKRYVCNGCFVIYYEECGRCKVCGYTQRQEEADISQMSLIDLIEMICDWLAATKRHEDGDIIKSIEINQDRFHYSDELKNILMNTVMELD